MNTPASPRGRARAGYSEFRQAFRTVSSVAVGLLMLASAAPAGVVAAESSTPALRVMSFNIRYGTASDGENSWPLRRDLVVRTIGAFKPDLLGVQEALTFQCEFLQQHLPDFAFHGVGRDDGRQAGEYCGIFYRKDRFELVDAGHFWLSETPSTPGSVSWDSSLTRMLSWVVLRDRRAGGRELVYANTHFDHRGRQARLESARLIRRRAAEVLPEMPAILTGDFNTTEDGEPYAALVRGDTGDRTRLIDAYRTVHAERRADEASFNGWKLVEEGSRIDWILHSDHLTAVEAAIDRTNDAGRFPSDHYPVEAVLEWR